MPRAQAFARSPLPQVCRTCGSSRSSGNANEQDSFRRPGGRCEQEANAAPRRPRCPARLRAHVHRWCVRRAARRRCRRPRQEPRPERLVSRQPGRARHEREPDHGQLRPRSADHDPGPVAARSLRPARNPSRCSSGLLGVPHQGAGGRREPQHTAALCPVRRASCPQIPDRQGLHHRQRAQPASLLAAAVRELGPKCLGRLVLQAARCVLRRPQGCRPRDPSDRSGTVTPWRRPAGCCEQRLDLPRPVHQRSRKGVPGERPQAADHGRARVPPVSRIGTETR